jgi:acylphosphatase
MTKSCIIRVSGKVQGVGFRFYTQKEARLLGVSGFVKNMRDGSVYIEAEAEADVMEAFILWCRKGPEWARVDDINTQDKPIEKFDGFDIR